MADPLTDPFSSTNVIGARPYELADEPQAARSVFTPPPPPPKPAPASIFTDPIEAQRLETSVQPNDPSPDEVARLYRLQVKTGLPVDLIRRNLKDVELEVARQDFEPEKFRQTSPLFASWVSSDRYHAALVQDDIAPMSTADTIVQKGRALVGAPIAGIFRQTGAGFWGLLQGYAEMDPYALHPEARGTTPAVDAAFDKLGAFSREMRLAAGGTADIVAGRAPLSNIDPRLDALAHLLGYAVAGPQTTEAFLRPRPPGGWLEESVLSGLESAGAMVPILLFGPEGGVTSMGASTAGSSYGQARDQGVTPTRAQMFASWQGLVESGTELIPAERLFKDLGAGASLKAILAHQFKTELIGEELATAFQDLGEWFTLPENKDKTFIDYLYDRPSAAAATAIAVLVTVGSTSVVAHGTARVLERLGETTGQSKTFTRTPEKVAAFLDQAAAGSPLATVYLPIDTFATYWQSHDQDPNEVATRLTGDATAYTRARAAGTELAVPLGAYVTQLATTDAGAFFAQEARTVAGQMNAREAEQFSREVANANVTDTTDPNAQAPAADTTSPAARVRTAVVQQLVAAGTPQQTADAMATVYQAVYGTLAQRVGLDPLELYNARPLRVSRPDLVAPIAAAAAVTREGVPLEGQSSATLEASNGAQQQTRTPWRAAAILLERIRNATRRRAGLSDADPQRVAAQQGGRPDAANPDAGARAREPVQIPDAYADDFGKLLTGARANGFTGTDDDFAALFSAQLDAARQIARDLNDYETSDVHNGHDLLAAVAKAGGLGIEVEGQSTEYSSKTGRLVSSGGMVGELEDLLEGLNRHGGRVKRGERAGQKLSKQLRRSGGLPGIAGIIVRSGGLSVDYMREAINGDVRWAGQFDDSATFLTAVSDAILVELGVKKAPGASSYDLGNILDGLLNVRPDTEWWRAPEAVDAADLEGGLDGAGDTSFDVTEFDQRLEATDTPAFRAWFGKSVTVDEAGNPRVFYHGTATDFDAFDLARVGEGRGAETERALFFSSTPDTANHSASVAGVARAEQTMTRAEYLRAKREAARAAIAAAGTPEAAAEAYLYPPYPERGSVVYPVFLKIENPFISKLRSYTGADMTAELEKARAAGHDGILFPRLRMEGESDTVAVFSPTQVKSATGNRGTFDAGDPNILLQDRRGFIQIGKTEFHIGLLPDANLSTFLHETGHLFFELFGNVAEHVQAIDESKRTPAQQTLLHDYQAVLRHVGLEAGARLSVEQHEEFARTYEAYLRDGKAPAAELRGAFARFRAWLLSIYRTLTQMRVRLTPEVRAVLDRMHASDVAIGQAEQDAQVAPLFQTPAGMGVSPAEFALYAEKVEQAGQAARDELEQRLLADVRREQETAWKTARAAVRATVEAELHAQPVFQALAAMQRGTTPAGEPLVEGLDAVPLKLSKQILVKRYGADRLKELPKPRIYTTDGGLDPDAVADRFGFSSGDELLTAVAAAGPLPVAIERETDRQMLAEHGSLLLDGTLHDDARRALANAEHDAVIRAELRALAQLERQARPFLAVGEAALEAEKRERAYERQWFEAEARLRIAIAEGRKQVEIDALQAEVQALGAQVRGGAVQLRAGIRAAAPSDEQLAGVVQQRIATLRVDQIQPSTYWTAARRASRAATEAAARQEFGKAIEAKQKELLNLALYRAAVAARDDVEKRIRRARSYGTPAARARLGKAGDSYLEQVDGILGQFDFVRLPASQLTERQSIATWVESQQAQGLPVDLPAIVLNDVFRVSYTQLTYEQLVGVTDGLEEIVHIARLKNRLLKTVGDVDFGVRRGELALSIRNNNPTRETKLEYTAKDEKLRTVADWFASHSKLSFLARALDGYQDGGAMWEAIIRPLNAAADEAHVRRTAAAEAFSKIITEHYPTKDLAGLGEKVFIRSYGLNASLTKEARLAVALNWGNETSRSRLMNDPVRKWKEQDIRAILDTLDERDWKFVQATWDYLDTFWPEIAAKQKRVTGLAPNKVEALPVVTKFGTFRGGYYPLKYDGRLFARAGQNQIANEAKLATSAGYVRTTTARGHVEARKSNVEMSVLLDLGVAFSHLDQVIHDLTHHEMLIDVTRLLRDPMIAQSILATQGDVVYSQFTNALGDIALGYIPSRGIVEKAAGFMRTGTQLALLGWNLWTALQQPLGLFNGMHEVGIGPVTRGLHRWLRDASTMELTTKWINEVSPFMRARAVNATQDLADLRTTFVQPGGWFDTLVRRASGDHLTQQHILDSFLWHIGLAQRVADVPTWLGGYEKAMAADPADEARAIALADQAVINAQGSGSIKDLAQVQRGTHIARLYLTFYSYGNLVFNQTKETVSRVKLSNPASVTTMLGHLSLIYLLPALGTVSLAHIVGRASNNDDLLDWVKQIGREVLATALNTMVFVRELSGLVNEGSRGYAGPAGARALEMLYRLNDQVKQGTVDEGLLKATNAVGGVLFRYPAAQAERTVDGAVALVEGRTHNPAALLFGPPKEK